MGIALLGVEDVGLADDVTLPGGAVLLGFVMLGGDTALETGGAGAGVGVGAGAGAGVEAPLVEGADALPVPLGAGALAPEADV